MSTPSRRTGRRNEEILRRGRAGLPAEIWDGDGENPYFGILALADHVVVTGDSVNMVSEAASTGKPVHVVHLQGSSAKRSEEHTSELQSLMRISYDVFCLKKKNKIQKNYTTTKRYQ